MTHILPPDVYRRIFSVLADLPRRAREDEREINGMSSQEPDPIFHDPVSGQARMDREWAEERIAEMGLEMGEETPNPDEALFPGAFRLGHSFALIATDTDGNPYLAFQSSNKEDLIQAAETSFRDLNPRIYWKLEGCTPRLVYPKKG